MAISINTFKSDKLSHTYWFNKYGIVNFVFYGVAGQNDVFMSMKVIFYLSKH